MREGGVVGSIFENLSYEELLQALDPIRLEEIPQDWRDTELYWLECNEKDCKDLLDVRARKLADASLEFSNDSNSSIVYALGIVDKLPTRAVDKNDPVLPDIDFDIEPEGREKLKAYFQELYGKENVALIGTYQSLGPKSAIKDVLRQELPDKPNDEVNRLTKRLDEFKPADFDSDLELFEEAITSDDELRSFFSANPSITAQVKSMLGVVKGGGIHAAGIVVANKPISRIVGIEYAPGDRMWKTQPTMAWVEKAMLIKFDILGLITLSEIRTCLDLIEQRTGEAIDIYSLGNDDFVLEDIRKCNTDSIFQVGTETAKGMLGGIRDGNFKDKALIPMLTSIGRPGPMNMGMDKTFVKRVNGDEKVTYPHKLLEGILGDTYGIIVYQEQIMQIVQEFGKITEKDSVAVLKAMGKKVREVLESYKPKFIKGASESGMDIGSAEKVWALMESFAEYGFNKSHAVSYGMTSYICAFLKFYYHSEWGVAVLSNRDKSKLEDFYFYWQDILLKPTINGPIQKFEIREDGRIQIPVSTIGNVGATAVKGIEEAQPYSSFNDFLERSKSKKNVTINLILAGAFDAFRPETTTSLKTYRLSLIKELHVHRFGENSQSKDAIVDRESIMEYEAMPPARFLLMELRLLGFLGYDLLAFQGSKVSKIAAEKWRLQITPISQFQDAKVKSTVAVAGLISETVVIKVKKQGKNFGREMMLMKIRSGKDVTDITVFPDDFEKNRDRLMALETYFPVLVRGQVGVYQDRKNMSFIDMESFIAS